MTLTTLTDLFPSAIVLDRGSFLSITFPGRAATHLRRFSVTRVGSTFYVWNSTGDAPAAEGTRREALAAIGHLAAACSI